MPTYRFEATNSQGQTVRNVIEAASEEEAIQKVRGQKLFVTRVQPAPDRGGTAVKRRRKSITLGGVSNKQLTLFTRQLSTLQDAGLPIVRSVKILESQLQQGALKDTLAAVADEVEGGMSFSEALARHPKAFDALYVNMVRAGEAGGVLDTILQRLAEFREKSQRLKRQVMGAMIYPAAVLLAAAAIVTGILTYVVPKFKKMFAEFDFPMPALTQALLAISDFVQHSWYWGFGAIAALALFAKLLSATPPGRLIVDKIKLRLPLFGTLINKSVIARFTRTLGTLVASGVPILEALSITKATAGNAVVARAIGRVHDSIREGENIAGPLAQSGICDVMVINMIDVGEKTGDLDKMLMKIADQYDEDVDVAVAGLTRLIEPMLIVLLGACVGFIVLSLFLPLIELMKRM